MRSRGGLHQFCCRRIAVHTPDHLVATEKAPVIPERGKYVLIVKKIQATGKNRSRQDFVDLVSPDDEKV